MKSMSKKALTALSASSLAAGMAHGTILYTNLNQTVVGSGGDSVEFDLNQDGFPDYNVTFDNNNNLKPFISNTPGIQGTSPTTCYVLSDASDNGGANSQGLPATPAGISIDSNYESDQDNGYFLQDTGANYVGGWTNTTGSVEAFVGLELDDSQGTHYGWARFIYNQNVVTNGIKGTLTIVDCAMETQPGVAIITGETAEPGLPSFSVPPASQTNYVGGAAQFNAVGVGNPSPTFQWMAGAVGSGVYTNLTDGGNISGSATANLTISNITPASAADFIVVLSNTSGSVTSSVPARLTIVPAIITGITPTPVELYSGVNASIQVESGSAGPITYQWRKNGVNLSDGNGVSGTASQTLVLSDTSTGESGQYSVVLSNSYGAVTSLVDNVTIVAPEAPYQQAMIALAPVSLYSFSETNDPASSNAIAFDLIGGHNGTYGPQTENGNPNYNIAGPRPTPDGFLGFSSSNTAFLPGTANNSALSRVTIPPMNLNSNSCTFTAWLYPNDNGPDYAVVLTFRGLASGTANGLNLSPDGSLGYHWNDNQYSYQSELFPPVDQWSFVALVITPSGAIFYLCDGTGASLSITNATDSVSLPSQALANPGSIGGDTVDPNFMGSIDEIALFNYALTESQITNLYNVAVTGVITTNTPPPTPILTIQYSGGNAVLNWTSGVLLQAPSATGPWTVNSSATSPYTVPPTGSQMFYRARSQ